MTHVAAVLGAVAPEPTFAVPANVAFAITAVFMVFAALRVVTTKNVVHAALWLVVVLGGVGVNYLLLQAEFLAVTQFLVYLGAIVVLFLFGIMLTRAPLGRADDLDNDQRPLGIAIGLILLAVISFSLIRSWGTDELTFEAYRIADTAEAAGIASGRTGALADTIFGDYLIPFEATSVLLLAALIGAIVLARRD
jgi:NADH-quinone oxidoreductase subunit J